MSSESPCTPGQQECVEGEQLGGGGCIIASVESALLTQLSCIAVETSLERDVS